MKYDIARYNTGGVFFVCIDQQKGRELSSGWNFVQEWKKQKGILHILSYRLDGPVILLKEYT